MGTFLSIRLRDSTRSDVVERVSSEALSDRDTEPMKSRSYVFQSRPMQTAFCALAGVMTLTACHTTAAPTSGYLSTYDGLEKAGRDPGVALRQRRDDAASDRVAAVFIVPAVYAQGVGEGLSQADRAMVLNEVDRQICFEVSERFDIASSPGPQTATIRTAVVRLHPTGRVGSVVSAAAGYFVPVVSLRPPMTTGGIAVEAELLEAETGRQIAAIAWGRNAQYVGRDSGSLSRVGDALQMAEPMGDAVGDAFSSKVRAVRPIPDPDPCAVFGPRRNVGRTAAGFLVGAATGLYAPEASGEGAARRPQEP